MIVLDEVAGWSAWTAGVRIEAEQNTNMCSTCAHGKRRIGPACTQRMSSAWLGEVSKGCLFATDSSYDRLFRTKGANWVSERNYQVNNPTEHAPLLLLFLPVLKSITSPFRLPLKSSFCHPISLSSLSSLFLQLTLLLTESLYTTDSLYWSFNTTE